MVACHPVRGRAFGGRASALPFCHDLGYHRNLPVTCERRLKTSLKLIPPGAVTPLATGRCANCGSAIEGNFCASCGQATQLHVPSIVEFVHEFIGHHVALEGKLWKTLALLLCRPGRLTGEYIVGRRVRYIAPLRLYLTLSVLFFALLKFTGTDLVTFDAASAKKVPAFTVVKGGAPVARVNGGAAGSGPFDEINPGSDDAIKFDARFKRMFPGSEAKVRAFFAMSNEDKVKTLTNGFYEYVPYATFCMLPMFALYLKLLYLGTGRRYGEHLLFALHTNAFAFILFGLIKVAPWPLVKALLFLWVVAYVPMAMQRVYGGRKYLTAMRWMLLMLAHILTLTLAIVMAIGLSVVM